MGNRCYSGLVLGWSSRYSLRMRDLRQHCIMLLLALNGIDAGLTFAMAAIAGPDIEANPIMRCLLRLTPWAFLGFKVVFAHAVITLQPPIDSKWWHWVPMGGATALYAFVVIRNGLILTGHW